MNNVVWVVEYSGGMYDDAFCDIGSLWSTAENALVSVELDLDNDLGAHWQCVNDTFYLQSLTHDKYFWFAGSEFCSLVETITIYPMIVDED